MAVTGVWLIAASVVWLAGVVTLVVCGLAQNTEGLRGTGCRGDGCRSDAGFQGSGTQPRPAEPARGDTGWRA